MNRVLVVAPHPDDETLGCGGTLLRHKAEGDTLHWLIATKISEELGFSAQRVAQRDAEISSVAKAYGFDQVHFAGLNTMYLDTYPKKVLVDSISTVFAEVQPSVVYTPYRLDAHSDHEAVYDAVLSCTKSFRYPSIKSVRAYETLSETEFGIRPEGSGFNPNLFIDISDYLEKKIEIMSLYAGELAPHPFPRSSDAIRALATLRGSTAGCLAAEAFLSLREIL